MIRKLIAAFAAISLSACTPMLGGFGAAPAPLERTTIDDRGLETAWKVFDLTLDAINLLGDYGILVPGTPAGKSVSTAVRTVNKAFAVAEYAAAAGSTTDYKVALEAVNAGVKELQATVASLKGKN